MQLIENLTIAKAEPSDLLDIFSIVDSYADGENINADLVKNNLRNMVYQNSVLLARHNGFGVGGVGGIILPSIFSNDFFFCVMFFYIRPEFRFLTRRILQQIEQGLKSTKVTKIIIGVWGENKTYEKQLRFMRIMGYRLLETHMVKKL